MHKAAMALGLWSSLRGVWWGTEGSSRAAAEPSTPSLCRLPTSTARAERAPALGSRRGTFPARGMSTQVLWQPIDGAPNLAGALRQKTNKTDKQTNQENESQEGGSALEAQGTVQAKAGPRKTNGPFREPQETGQCRA